MDIFQQRSEQNLVLELLEFGVRVVRCSSGKFGVERLEIVEIFGRQEVFVFFGRKGRGFCQFVFIGKERVVYLRDFGEVEVVYLIIVWMWAMKRKRERLDYFEFFVWMIEVVQGEEQVGEKIKDGCGLDMRYSFGSVFQRLKICV